MLPHSSSCSSAMSPLRKLLLQPDMADHILGYCELVDIVAFSHAGPFGREIFQVFFTVKFRSAITQFVASEFYESFLRTLDTTSAVIVGSVASLLAKLLDGSAAWDLNLLTPFGTMVPWVTVITEMGGRKYGSTVQNQYGRTLNHYMRFVVPHGRITGKATFISVSETRSTSVLPALTLANDTSQMTMVTHERVIIPYGITLLGKCLPSVFVEDRNSYVSPHFEPYCPKTEQRSCGWACRYLERSFTGFKGIREVAWRKAGSGSYKANSMRDSDECWYLGYECDNVHCGHHGKPFRALRP
ncbi:hypothetical protein DFH06DRAFT_1479886 [Mycena polygramma]|nr:hypothetical protein DFH06DRAFT_1479886 [Mycena polygramma]